VAVRYDGNAWVNGSTATAPGQLVVAKRRMVTLTELSVPAVIAPGTQVTTRVTKTEPTGAPVSGVVGVYDGTTLLASGEVGTDGTTRLTLPATLAAGHHVLRAEYAGSTEHLPSTSANVPVDVPTTTSPSGPNGAAKARATVGGTVRLVKRTARLTVVVTGATPATGTVQVRDGKRLLRTVTLSGGRAAVRLPLTRGRHTLTATYSGSATLLAGTRSWSVRVR
jgi:hypothetical protein